MYLIILKTKKMKITVKLLLMFLVIILITIGQSCDKEEDDNCPDRLFDTLEECEDATDGKKCICIKEGDKWEAVINP